MNRIASEWAPAVLLGLGVMFVVGIDTQQSLQLRAALSSVVPDTMFGFSSRNVALSESEIRVSGVADYLMRFYEAQIEGTTAIPSFSVYVGYYDRQVLGRTIHSPKNCMPGAGWEALETETIRIETAGGIVKANQYLLQKDQQLALVLYWYQGRGRVEASEYAVKWNLLRDAAIHRRSDEALVRIVVPVQGSKARASEVASDVASEIIPSLDAALPE